MAGPVKTAIVIKANMAWCRDDITQVIENIGLSAHSLESLKSEGRSQLSQAQWASLLESLPNLKELSLNRMLRYGEKISVELLQAIANHKQLRKLNLSNNGVDDQALKILARSSSLIHLEACGSRFTSEGLHSLKGSALEYLDISCHLTQGKNVNFSLLKELKNLTTLIANNVIHLSTEHIEALCLHTKIQVISTPVLHRSPPMKNLYQDTCVARFTQHKKQMLFILEIGLLISANQNPDSRLSSTLPNDVLQTILIHLAGNLPAPQFKAVINALHQYSQARGDRHKLFRTITASNHVLPTLTTSLAPLCL